MLVAARSAVRGLGPCGDESLMDGFGKDRLRAETGCRPC